MWYILFTYLLILHYFASNLKGELWFSSCKFFADSNDEQCVVRWDAQTWRKITHKAPIFHVKHYVLTEKKNMLAPVPSNSLSSIFRLNDFVTEHSRL